jgi:hypothetical protein
MRTVLKLIALQIFLVNTIASANLPDRITISKERLLNKIKGGWAGQTIGVTYGGPTEFRYKGVMIPDTTKIKWDDEYVKWYFLNQPGLYDDLYMDLTFVEQLEKLGLNAPVDAIAKSFANADFMLWHANQAARYNILNGIMPPASGNWKNNLHSSCIDFQIEADFAGLMSPGMINTAGKICDKIGHIMNYGDGWYGGVYVASMYSLAFVSDDIDFIIHEGLKSIPSQSHYYQCMMQVIDWSKKYPDDWRKVWNEVENSSWRESCPKGIDDKYNIESIRNSAYVLIGLLYGKGDFFKTMDIATRCGQDSDCNPSTACGILGTILGYDKIPSRWLNPLQKAEDINFQYTSMSLNETYRVGLKHALQEITLNGGKVDGDNVTIRVQTPKPVKLEQAPELNPKRVAFKGTNLKKQGRGFPIDQFSKIDFEGTGIAINGRLNGDKSKYPDYIAEVDFMIDQKKIKTMKLPLNPLRAATELFWTFDLPHGKHTLEMKWRNRQEGVNILLENMIEYSKK